MLIQKISVVIPVFNEQESLPELLRRTDAACQRCELDYEIVLVDDGSQDDSGEMIAAAANQPGSHVVAILLNRNYGQHSAIMAGFSHVSGDLIVTLDADLQNPPEEIPQLVAAAQQGYDVVGTVRQNRQDSWFRRRASRTINLLIQRVTGKAMGDYGCMLRAYRRHIIDAIWRVEIQLYAADQPDVRPDHLPDHHAAAHAKRTRQPDRADRLCLLNHADTAAAVLRIRLGR